MYKVQDEDLYEFSLLEDETLSFIWMSLLIIMRYIEVVLFDLN